MPLKVIVTGAAGFIGSHLSEALVAAGHHVVGIDAFVPYYERSVKEANLAAIRDHPRFEVHEADLRTATLEPLLDGADAIVHQAAMPGLAQSWVDLDGYSSCNIIAVQRLLDAARAVGSPRLLHISTSSVYGVEAVGPETIPTRPISPYGITKLAGEQLVLAYVDLFGMNASILRYFSMYGPRQRPDMGYHRFIEAMLDGRPITLYGDGRQSRSNTYIDDGIAGTVSALEHGQPGEVYNIGGGVPITVAEAIDVIAGEVGTRPTIDRQPPRPGDQRHTAADTSKARGAFGFEPRVAPEVGLRRQVAWHRARRAGPDADPEHVRESGDPGPASRGATPSRPADARERASIE